MKVHLYVTVDLQMHRLCTRPEFFFLCEIYFDIMKTIVLRWWNFQHTSLPVFTMKNYLALRPTTVGQFNFVNSLGKHLTKQELTRKTRQLLSQAGFQASNFAWSQLSNWRCNYSSLRKTALLAHKNSGPLVIWLLRMLHTNSTFDTVKRVSHIS
jgi:hypothetical protein